MATPLYIAYKLHQPKPPEKSKPFSKKLTFFVLALDAAGGGTVIALGVTVITASCGVPMGSLSFLASWQLGTGIAITSVGGTVLGAAFASICVAIVVKAKNAPSRREKFLQSIKDFEEELEGPPESLTLQTIFNSAFNLGRQALNDFDDLENAEKLLTFAAQITSHMSNLLKIATQEYAVRLLEELKTDKSEEAVQMINTIIEKFRSLPENPKNAEIVNPEEDSLMHTTSEESSSDSSSE